MFFISCRSIPELAVMIDLMKKPKPNNQRTRQSAKKLQIVKKCRLLNSQGTFTNTHP